MFFLITKHQVLKRIGAKLEEILNQNNVILVCTNRIVVDFDCLRHKHQKQIEQMKMNEKLKAQAIREK